MVEHTDLVLIHVCTHVSTKEKNTNTHTQIAYFLDCQKDAILSSLSYRVPCCVDLARLDACSSQSLCTISIETQLVRVRMSIWQMSAITTGSFQMSTHTVLHLRQVVLGRIAVIKVGCRPSA